MSSKKSTKKQQITDTKNKTSVERASGLNIETTLADLTKSGLKIQATLASVSENLTTKYADLKAVEDTISIKKAELESLHGADKILMSIDELKAEHDKTLAELDAEQTRIRDEIAQAEQDEKERRAREQAQFEYDLRQARKAEDDNWQEALRVRKRDELIRQETFDKNLKEREAVLAAKEKEYQAALDKAATFDAEVKKEVDKQVAITSSAIKRDFEHKAEISAVQTNAKISELAHAGNQKDATIASLQSQVADLQAQLKEAHASQVQLAKDAVAAASNTKQIADMQSMITNVGGNGQRPRS